MRKRIFAAFVCLCMLMALVPSMAYAGDTVSVGGLCEHHTQHDGACGYSEGAAETPCGHEHTEDCYTLVTKCVHAHTAECYSEESAEPICGHVCSEESGCITKELNCNHEHDENCGYIPATAGTPCNFVCEICNAQVAEEPECICDTKCTEGERNDDCPVCGGEDGNISICVGAASAMLFSPMSTRSITPAKPLGNGTEENPYQITNAAELYWFAGLVNGDKSIIGNSIKQNTGACAVLIENITINENVLNADGSLNGNGSGLEQWPPIGSYGIRGEEAYIGTFDGNGHTISGLYVDSNDQEVGLFGCVGKKGKIQNVGVVDSYISATANGAIVGGVCGHNYEGTIENCYNTGTVTGSGINVGGVCGGNSWNIINCYNTGKVSTTDDGACVGGVCGYNTKNIKNCYNTGKISVTIHSSFVGGVCGMNFGGINNCYFLTGTADKGIGVGSSIFPNEATEKTENQFKSGEVAWLLNDSQNPQPWGQGSNGIPVLVDNLPKDVTYTVPVCVTIQMPDGTSEQGYTTARSTLATYPNGYVFFEDGKYTIWIDKATKTYDVDTTIYAALPVNNITLNKTELSLYVNSTETLTAIVSPDNAYNKTLHWESSNPSVATVDSNGNVKAISRGEAVITATAADGQGAKAECTVTVKKKSSGGSVFFWDLKFDTNGGSDINTVTEWEYSTIDLDDYVPEKEGYKFVGWYADEDLTKEIDEVYLTEDTTVYAKWEKIEEEVPEESEEVEETEETEETETISFLDVKKSDWFYEAVSYAVENVLMSGMSEDIFAPNTPLTREMLAVVLYNVEGQPEGTEANTFTDVKGDMWYTDAILWANENGIVAGYDNGAYGVGDLITREQFATILYRYAQFKGYDTTQGGMAVREFSDYVNISDYARPAMAWAVNAGIMGGMDDGTLMPQGKATRAEAATMLMNFCENMVEK
ncbi:S-layer homology domain-containing protein [Anaerotignum lactatifermentans]|uniref:S-layer homology domain-containing protein n=1 Tax=Anaerotignum lactatifermentans TaxID=160404 RepID=UPI0026321CB9|nr:S-layer homology domain-containing protein [Anaerotignum lactatifermentans]